MFDKMRQLKKLKDLESELKKELTEKEVDGVKVSVNGGMEIIDMKLNPELDIEKQQKALKDCTNNALNEAKFKMAKKAQEQMSGFGF